MRYDEIIFHYRQQILSPQKQSFPKQNTIRLNINHLDILKFKKVFHFKHLTKLTIHHTLPSIPPNHFPQLPIKIKTERYFKIPSTSASKTINIEHRQLN